MLDDLGGGELLIYDPDLRLRTVKRSTGGRTGAVTDSRPGAAVTGFAPLADPR